MRKLPRKYLPIILMFLIASGIIYHNFYKILACPECYLYEDAGDGLKNYFTFTWYVLQDKGTHFSGMNAPYGEHIFFTDNHPGLAMFCNFLHRHVIDLNGHTIGIINILLIVSLFVSCLVLYKIFRLLAVGRYVSVVFALIITFLSPQVARFTGHFSLGYVCFIPIFLWIFIRFQLDKKKWRWVIFGVTWVALAGFTHLYYFLMMSVFVGFYFLIDMFRHKPWMNWPGHKNVVRNRFIQLICMLIVPAILLLGFLRLTDTITDRPTSPWKGLGLNAKFHGTFIPNYGPFPDYWNDLFKTTQPDVEAMSYVSLVGFFMIPVAIAFLFRKRRRRRSSPQGTDLVHPFLLASIGVWAIAAGILYSPIFSWIMDIIPKLKQFRGMGRLAWMFYYVYTIFIGFYLYRTARLLTFKKMKITGVYIVIIPALIMGFEAYLVQRPILGKINKSNQYLNIKNQKFSDLLAQKDLKAEDFQAILQLPMINLGGETSGLDRGNWTMRKGIQASFDLRLPLIDWSLSRTSVSQSTDFVQLLSSSAVSKTRIERMNQKPLLVICEENLITPAEKNLIDKAKFIGEIETIRVYRLETDDFQQDPSFWKQKLDSTQSSSPPIIEKNFEDDPHPNSLIGSGFKKVNDAKELIYTFESDLDTAVDATLHLWVRVDQNEASMSVLRVREIDPNGNIRYDLGIHRRDVDWSEVIGQWLRIDRPMQVKTKGFTYELYIDVAGTVIDGLQIRDNQKETILEYPDDDIAFYNGVLIQLPDQ